MATKNNSKKATPTEAADEWRSLAIQERARAQNAEAWVASLKSELYRYQNKERRRMDIRNWWEDHKAELIAIFVIAPVCAVLVIWLLSAMEGF